MSSLYILPFHKMHFYLGSPNSFSTKGVKYDPSSYRLVQKKTPGIWLKERELDPNWLVHIGQQSLIMGFSIKMAAISNEFLI